MACLAAAVFCCVVAGAGALTANGVSQAGAGRLLANGGVGANGPHSSHAGPVAGVANGQEINDQQWFNIFDWVVYIQGESATGDQNECTGIIRKKTVLTAARCYMVGKHRLFWVFAASSSEQLRATRAEKHFAFQNASGVNNSYDFMLLEVERALTPHSSFVLLSGTVGIYKPLSTAGFGLTEAGPGKKPLAPVLISGMRQRQCPQFAIWGICVWDGQQGNKSTCVGDAGGPWYYWEHRINVVVGIQSTTFGQGRCGEPNRFSVYNPVVRVEPWIVARTTDFVWIREPGSISRSG